jgi:hypothetical protein
LKGKRAVTERYKNGKPVVYAGLEKKNKEDLFASEVEQDGGFDGEVCGISGGFNCRQLK